MNQKDMDLLAEVRKGFYGHEKVMRLLSIIDGLEAEIEQFNSVDIVPKARLREAEKQRDAALAEKETWRGQVDALMDAIRCSENDHYFMAGIEAVRRLREKAERAEENRDGWKVLAENNESIAGDALKQLDEMRKDRDAWKELATLEEGKKKEARQDADRLAGALKDLLYHGTDFNFYGDDGEPQVARHEADTEKAKEALAAHESQQGVEEKRRGKEGV